MSSSNVSDQDRAIRFLEGDPQATEEVRSWIAKTIPRQFKRGVLSGVWDDVLQDVRLEVSRLLEAQSFHGESALKTYLWRVVCNICLDRIRYRRRWRWSELEGTEEWEADAILGDPGGTSNLEPASKDLLLNVLSEVGEECRELWSMVLAGLSYREMSRRTGVAEGALRVRVLRCRKQALEIRERIEQQGQRISYLSQKALGASEAVSENLSEDFQVLVPIRNRLRLMEQRLATAEETVDANLRVTEQQQAETERVKASLGVEGPSNG